jgi:hypothetical protein
MGDWRFSTRTGGRLALAQHLAYQEHGYPDREYQE